MGESAQRLSPNSLMVNGNGSPADRKLKSASLPPPDNRANKPKIPAKPPQFSHPDSNSLAPRSEIASSDDHVSPFNTPPSSPEKAPAKPSSSSKLPRSFHLDALPRKPQLDDHLMNEGLSPITRQNKMHGNWGFLEVVLSLSPLGLPSH